jgi:hypothetical protein
LCQILPPAFFACQYNIYLRQIKLN